MTRNLCVFIDGTMQDRSKEEAATDSNVVRLYNASPDVSGGEVEQRSYYRKGVGTRSHEAVKGGALGFGLDERIDEALAWLEDESAIAVEDGRTPRVFLFGFSRGAFAVRVLAARYGREIEFIGVWDTVKATLGGDFGVAELPAYVKRACHAMALDERRAIFDVFRFNASDRVDERWFSGSHTDVGGGYAEHELADIPLGWIAEEARASGLVVDAGQFGRYRELDLASGPRIHQEDSALWAVASFFKGVRKTFERAVGVADVVDDSVIFIRDHWGGLIGNTTLAANRIFAGSGDEGKARA